MNGLSRTLIATAILVALPVVLWVIDADGDYIADDLGVWAEAELAKCGDDFNAFAEACEGREAGSSAAQLQPCRLVAKALS